METNKEKIVLKQEDLDVDFNKIRNIESVEIVKGELILHLELK